MLICQAKRENLCYFLVVKTKITNIGAELDFSQMKEERLRERKKDGMERLDSKMDYTFLLVMKWREEINCL